MANTYDSTLSLDDNDLNDIIAEMYDNDNDFPKQQILMNYWKLNISLRTVNMLVSI